MKNAIFDVSGMSCGSCVRHVTDALRQAPGVEVDRVSVGSAEVSFDPAKTTSAAIAQVIGAAGYEARERAGGVADRLGCRTDPKRGGGCCRG